MATFKNSNQVGKVQDLSSIVKDITPNDVPFLKSLSSEMANDCVFTWTDKDLGAVSVPTIAEGADLVDDGANYRTLRTNYTQIFAEAINISSTAISTKQAGQATLAERIADKVKQISRQKETVYLGGQAASGVETARKTASFQAQLASGAYVDKDPTSPITPVTMTKAFFDSALQAAYTNGADIDSVYVSPAMKKALSTLLSIAPMTREAGQGKTMTDSVDIYQSDFGDVNIMIDRYQDVNDILFADSSMWVEKVLTPMNVEFIGKTGLSEKRQVACEVGLLHRNFKGGYAILNVTP